MTNKFVQQTTKKIQDKIVIGIQRDSDIKKYKLMWKDKLTIVHWKLSSKCTQTKIPSLNRGSQCFKLKNHPLLYTKK